MKITNLDRVHFVGIGGIGMSALAQHLLRRGYTVTGSDRVQNEQTQKLQKLGATIFIGHSEDNVKGAQLVVRTSAIDLDNVEIKWAKIHRVPIILRERLLGTIFDRFPVRIAVCGTHGKTTATAMLHHVLLRCGVLHTAFIGGNYNGNNYFYGNNVVIAEACEYNRSFLNLHPTLCLCLNAEFDHPDCYKNQAEVECAFAKLFEQSQTVVLPAQNRKLCDRGVVIEDCVQAQNIQCAESCSFDFYCEGQFVSRIQMPLCGEHNITNALAALAVARQLNLPMLQAAQSLSDFVGVDRRWTKVSCAYNAFVDYAHHPTEIKAAIASAHTITRGKIVCVFQPHTYSRTKAFWKEFCTCFKTADEVVYLPVYAAREAPQRGVTSAKLCKKARRLGIKAKYFCDFVSAAEYLKQTLSYSDTLLILGAGDVVNLTKYLQ